MKNNSHPYLKQTKPGWNNTRQALSHTQFLERKKTIGRFRFVIPSMWSMIHYGNPSFILNSVTHLHTFSVGKLTKLSKELHSESSIDEKKEHEEQSKVPHLEGNHFIVSQVQARPSHNRDKTHWEECLSRTQCWQTWVTKGQNRHEEKGLAQHF